MSENTDFKSKPRLLLVEDSITQAFALRRLLEKNGFTVASAENGKEALDILRKEKIEIVLSDIDMPEMDGFQMCLEIKSSPMLRAIPVVLLTTLAESQNIMRGLASRADYYLTKPCPPAYLVERLNTFLEESHDAARHDTHAPVEIMVDGRKHLLEASNRQMLTLLLSTYDNSVQQNRELTKTQLELNERNQELHLQSERLQISERNFRALLESSVDGILVVNELGIVQFANPAAQRMLDKPIESILNHTSDFPASAGETHEIVIRPNELVVESRVVETTWQMRPAVLLSLRDITRRKQDELQIREQQEKLEQLATQDGLTGLRNFRKFREEFDREVVRANRSLAPLSLLLIDVDKFKDFNDTYGHLAGDDTLRSVAQLIQSAVRTTDLPARYGGEEFAVILPATGEPEGKEVAERIRRQIEGADWPLRRVTVSIGVAPLCADLGSCQELFAAADKALYSSKRTGRNQVTRWSQLPEAQGHAA